LRSVLASLLLTLLCAVPATAAEPSTLKLEPAELTLSANGWGGGAKAQILLVGLGARTFAAGATMAHVLVLHDSGDHEIKLKLEDFKPNRERPGYATAKLSLDGSPHVGSYSGEVTLFPLNAKLPRLKLTVHSHLPNWFAILLVGVGALLGGLAPLLYALNARRNVLFEALTDAMARLQDVAEGLRCEQACALARITWYLDDLASEDRAPPGTEQAQSRLILPTGNLPGVTRLRERIKEARNDRDLDEDTETVLDVIARIQRWLRLAPVTWRLHMVAGEPSTRSEEWRKTNTWRDTCMLLRRLRYEPQSAADADDLVARALWQIGWHHDFAELFARTAKGADKHAELSAEHAKDSDVHTKQGEGHAKDSDVHTGHSEQHAALLALEKKMTKNVFDRTPAEQDQLTCELRRLACDIGAAKIGCPPVPDGPRGLEVAWETSPSLFTGWATVDGASWRRVRARATQRKRSPKPRNLREPQLTPTRKMREPDPLNVAWLWLARKAPQVGSFLLLLVLPVLAASVFYALTLYNDTWGSWTDILTALTAGFAGKVAIDWGTLYIFQSNRLRPPSSAPVPAQTAASAGTATPAPAVSS